MCEMTKIKVRPSVIGR